MYYIIYCLSFLPLSLLYFFTDLLYPILYYICRYRVKVVRENLTLSFPDKSPQELRKIERQFYHFLCDYIAETIKLTSMSEKEMRRRMVFENMDILPPLFEKHSLLIMYLGHYCNWEWASSIGLWTSKDIHTAQLYRPLHNKRWDDLFLHIRSHFGGENIDKSKALRRMIKMRQKKQKTIIGFISDQNPEGYNIYDWIDFLHHDTAVFGGAEKIGRKMKASFCYLDFQRIKRGYYKATVRLITDNAKTMPPQSITETYFQLLEKTIYRQPQFWLWSHKRWKMHRTEEERLADQRQKEKQQRERLSLSSNETTETI